MVFSTLPIQTFLDSVDGVGEALGLNVAPIVEIETLRALPDGTLGRTLADFLDTHHLAPLTTGPRRKQLHDSVHVLTGYSTDPISELEVQGFLLGSHFRLAHLLIGLGLLQLLYRQRISLPDGRIWDRIRQAYLRGKGSRFDIDAWQPELQWNWPLSQVQALLKIELSEQSH